MLSDKIFYIKPSSWMYDLHNLHVHPIGFHLFILSFKILMLSDSLISFGISSQVLGPIFLIVSVPYFTVLTESFSQNFLFLKLWRCAFSINNAFMGRGDRLFFTVYISTANLCRFL